MDRTFTTSRDAKLKWITAAVFALIIVLGGVLAYGASLDPEPQTAERAVLRVVLVVYGIAMAAAVWLAVTYSPRAYRITDQDLWIERRAAPKRISLDSVVSVEHLDDAAMRGTWKVGGIGGPFCWHGWFRNKRLGDFYMSATRSDRMVLVRTRNQRIVLTPDSPDEFMETLRRHLRT